MGYNFDMDKQVELKKIEAELAANMALPLRDTANLVFGEGNVDCKVMFIGEAPGVNEDRMRRPFVGRGGQLLDDMIRGLGWKREDVYITNIVKRRPPENRDPFPAEIEAYKPYLTRQIEVIDPKLIVTLGRFSMNYFLPEAKITRDHGRPLMIDGRTIFPGLSSCGGASLHADDGGPARRLQKDPERALGRVWYGGIAAGIRSARTGGYKKLAQKSPSKKACSSGIIRVWIFRLSILPGVSSIDF